MVVMQTGRRTSRVAVVFVRPGRIFSLCSLPQQSTAKVYHDLTGPAGRTSSKQTTELAQLGVWSVGRSVGSRVNRFKMNVLHVKHLKNI